MENWSPPSRDSPTPRRVKSSCPPSDPDIPDQALRRGRTHLVPTHPRRDGRRRLRRAQPGGNSSFHVTAAETLAGVIAEYAAACAKSRQIAAGHRLDDTAEHRLVGTVNLRFIYLCMIGDIARHAGQADILVEQIPSEPA